MSVSFKYVAPTPAQLELMNDFRERYAELYEAIKQSVPPNRGLSIALTKFEESAMWLNKAITENC